MRTMRSMSMTLRLGAATADAGGADKEGLRERLLGNLSAIRVGQHTRVRILRHDAIDVYDAATAVRRTRRKLDGRWTKAERACNKSLQAVEIAWLRG